MRFLELTNAKNDEYININIDHIVFIEPFIFNVKDNGDYSENAVIHLSTKEIITVNESMSCIENEYKELFKYSTK